MRTRVRARPRTRRPRGGVAPARGQDAGRRTADRRLRPQPPHAQPRGGAGRPRPGPGHRDAPRHRGDRSARARPRPPAVRPQRRAGAGRAQRRLRRLRGQRADPAPADAAGVEDLRRRRSLGRAQPDPRHARRLHQVPLGARGGARAPRGPRRRHAAGRREVRRLRRRPPRLRLGAVGRRGPPALPGGPGDGPRRRRRLLGARRRGRHRGRSPRPHPARPRRALGDRPLVVPARGRRRRPRRGTGRPAGGGQLAPVVVRREQAQPRRDQEPHQRPHRPLLRQRAAGDLRRDGGGAARAAPRRPGGARGHRGRDRGPQGDRRPLRDAGRRPGGADATPAPARRGARRGAVGARGRRPRPGLRRGLGAAQTTTRAADAWSWTRSRH